MELATVLGCHILSKLCCQHGVFKVSEGSGHTPSEGLICPLPRVSVKPLPPCMPLLRARQNELQALCLWNSATRLTSKWHNQFWNVRTAQEINFWIKNSCWGWTPARLKWWHSRVGHIPETQPGEFLLFPSKGHSPHGWEYQGALRCRTPHWEQGAESFGFWPVPFHPHLPVPYDENPKNTFISRRGFTTETIEWQEDICSSTFLNSSLLVIFYVLASLILPSATLQPSPPISQHQAVELEMVPV